VIELPAVQRHGTLSAAVFPFAAKYAQETPPTSSTGRLAWRMRKSSAERRIRAPLLRCAWCLLQGITYNACSVAGVPATVQQRYQQVGYRTVAI
jgi:hypothetical protein